MKRVGTLGNSIGPIVLAMYALVGEKQGLKPEDYTVNLQNDPLKEYLARGTQIIPAAPAASSRSIRWNGASRMRRTGRRSPFATTIECRRRGLDMGCRARPRQCRPLSRPARRAGLPIDSVAPLFHMFPDERHDFFVSVANLRALRKVWARLLSERYGAGDPRSLALKTTVYGHGQETLQEPLNNIVRIGFGTLAYVLGGASYVYIASYDEAVGTPTEETVKVAIRTQQNHSPRARLHRHDRPPRGFILSRR